MSRKIHFALCAACLLLTITLVYLPRRSASSSVQAVSGAKASPVTAEASSRAALFPELDVSSISHLEITAPDRNFSFIPGDAGNVSVNGQQGDGEIFTTLVSQITELPVSPQEAFSPQEDPLLTVCISFSGEERSVRFYRGVEDENARLIVGARDSLRYGETDAWRVGTLLLTCDGTRIQDERGNETPAR